MSRRELSGKRAIVTGASSGIGREIAIQLADDGVEVIACARRKDKLDSLVALVHSAGGKCVPVECDVTSFEQRNNLLATARTKWDGIDILVNSAGTTAMGPYLEAEPERLRRIFEVNFFATAELIRESQDLLRSGNKAIVVNISSVLGHRAVPLKSEYCASKFAVHGFSDALRAELSEAGIDVLLVSPSTTDSELFDAAIEDTTDTNWKKGGAMSPKMVARKTIRAIRKGKHEIILSAGGKFLVWIDRLWPTLANRIIARYGK